MSKRATGRGLFYTRDSGGEHENTPGEYVRWAQKAAKEQSVRFGGTPDKIERMMRNGASADGDLFLDFCVKGNLLKRPGLDALLRMTLTDSETSHIFIARRDRLARPDDPVQGIQIEDQLRRRGVTIVFMDLVLPPLGRGRRDMGEVIVGLMAYDKAGKERRDLASNILYAQLKLAKGGFSTGGRPPYGFCRWLVNEDGTLVRALADGESVKMARHHVIWLPLKDERVWTTIGRILQLLKSTPACRVAALLTREGIPPPDAGRERTDRGVRHRTSGVWHQTTVTAIARNPLLRASVEYGRRSMGDELRFERNGPRELGEPDLRADGKPKVIVNAEGDRITAPARFVSPVPSEEVTKVIQTLNERGGTQRGKPRSQDPSRNPLGCRVFDCGCGWPMYRQPYNGKYRYTCGLYQQSHGAKCQHNTVDGTKATQFVLACVRQRVLAPGFRDRIRRKLEEIAARELAQGMPDQHASKDLKESLSEVSRKLELVETNMALAGNEEQFKAVSRVFDQLRDQKQALEEQLREFHSEPSRDMRGEIDAALAVLDRMNDLASDLDNLTAIGELFRQINARLYLRFSSTSWGKRSVNCVSSGVLTFGATPSPIPLYEGPTGRRAMKGLVDGSAKQLVDSQVSGLEGGSFGNVSRADWI